VNGPYQKFAIIDRLGMGDGVEDGINGPNIGMSVEATESLFADRFDPLGEPALIVIIIFVLTASSRHGRAGVVDGLDSGSSRPQGRILWDGSITTTSAITST
jgi:hypothetical protein